MNRRGFQSRIISTFAVMLSVVSILSSSITSQIVYASDSIPAYSGEASIAINKNKPNFTKEDLTTTSYEQYGALDKLGRCTTAIACVGTDLMPTESIGSIGMIKPTGWKQNKYPGLVNSSPAYLYNRCHLIGYQLTGEGANKNNLITGTRYMNVEGMLPYENKVANYVLSTGNHVMYRVTPVFDGNNLLCSGVLMEAYSVEDSGKGVCFNVFCYNVQPGVILNYSDGSNSKDPNYNVAPTMANSNNNRNSSAVSIQAPTTNQAAQPTYIGNRNSKKFHYPSCSSVDSMKESNKVYFYGGRDEVISQNYEACKRCHP